MLVWKVARHQDVSGSASAAGRPEKSRQPSGGISQARRTSAQLIGLLRARVEVQLNAYGRVAASGRPEGEHLAVDDIAQLMTALDQGVSVLRLSGIASVDGALMRTGLRRLLDPESAAVEPSPVRSGHAPHMPDIEWVRRLTRDTPDA